MAVDGGGPAKTNPVTSGFGDIFSDLLWGETERTNLWSKSRGGTDFTTSRAQVAVVANQFSSLCAIESSDGKSYAYMIFTSFGSNFGAEVC